MNVGQICLCVGWVLVLTPLAASNVSAQKESVVSSVLMMTHAV
jgi:hypothetical protein